MKLGITGSRKGMTLKQREQIIDYINRFECISEVHHGDCVGVDSEVHEIVESTREDIKIIIHPPSNKKMRAFKSSNHILKEKTYLDRNKDIVKNCDVLIGIPRIGSRGTWYTINHAKRIGKDVHIIYE